MVNKTTRSLVLLALLASTAALAAPAPADVAGNIRALLPSTEVKSVETTGLEGVYEVTAGQNIFYMQPGKKILLVGHLFDLGTGKDMTQPQQDALQAAAYNIQWDKIPTAARISVGDEKAKREVVAFLDVDCPYCKQAYTALQATAGIRVHYVMLPLDGLHPESRDKTLNILCAADPPAALGTGMAGKPVPLSSNTACRAKAATGLDGVAKYAAAHQIQGTPFFVTNSGLVVPGLGDALTQWLQPQQPEKGQ
ncbi:MAG: DsbC family protein [Thiothrix sp.]|uniref:DsbC family protein n=1 Tax=Thiothrix sp. TaxID=1032 RepID=UPI0026060C0E|nr:DsbC family protein [Thiothrix sp.]MDD5395000.1 DsbC family protein [Thiothrix sp.]